MEGKVKTLGGVAKRGKEKALKEKFCLKRMDECNLTEEN